MPAFTTPGPIAATVEVAGAQVRVGASDRTDTVVLVEPVDKASKSDAKVAERTKVEFSGGRLTVKTTVPGSKNGSVAISIDLPAGSSLAASVANSSLHADGPLGECELHLASGQVQLDRIGALQANIAAGEVAVGHIAGRASIEGGTAAVRIGEVDGTVRLVGSAGQLWIGDARADLDLSSGSGTVHARTRHGDITIHRAGMPR
jgi:hypothetical protein